jgi:hypothetical protein
MAGAAVYYNELLRSLIFYTFGGLKHPTAILATTYIHPDSDDSLYSATSQRAAAAYYRTLGIHRDASDRIVYWPTIFWRWPSCPDDDNGYHSRKGIRHAWAKCGIGFSIANSKDSLLAIARRTRALDDQPELEWDKPRIVRFMLRD